MMHIKALPMSIFRGSPGDEVTFSKTIGESDVYLFAGITGDLSPNHVNEDFMSRSAYKRRIAHGALLVGFMSTASSLMIDKIGFSQTETAVSLGYDRIRFLAAALIGDTIKVIYRIKEVDAERRRSRSEVSVTNQNGELVAIAEHILKWVPNEPNPAHV